jgi:pimeloyl-ACP methyl ester carboxylesterase
MRVLLLHAFPLDERMWDPQRDALWEHEVVTPNLYSLAGQSMDMWAMALLREVWGDLVVVGASMGGYCALAFARLAPERVSALVLAGARVDADSPERRDDRMDTIGRAQTGGAQAVLDKMRPLLLAGGSEEAERQISALALEQSGEDLVKGLRAMRDRPDSSDVVDGLQAPLLVVVGDGDPLLPPDEANAVAASAPNGRAVVIEGAGHLPSLEQPDRFNDELLGLIATLE